MTDRDIDLDRLVKLLNMFGSAHDGEVLKAAERAHLALIARKLLRLRNVNSGGGTG